MLLNYRFPTVFFSSTSTQEQENNSKNMRKKVSFKYHSMKMDFVFFIFFLPFGNGMSLLLHSPTASKNRQYLYEKKTNTRNTNTVISQVSSSLNNELNLFGLLYLLLASRATWAWLYLTH